MVRQRRSVIFITRDEFEDALQEGKVRVMVTDEATYRERIQPLAHNVIAHSGHLVSVQLK